MYFSFHKAIEGLSLPSSIYKIVGYEDNVIVDNLTDNYIKIHNSKYSMYFQNNKLVLITKYSSNNMKEVFLNVDDAIKILFAPTNL